MDAFLEIAIKNPMLNANVVFLESESWGVILLSARLMIIVLVRREMMRSVEVII